jgi:addiction module HigA family antidote
MEKKLRPVVPMSQRTRRPSTPGEVVAQLLEEMGVSQRELARQMGVSAQTVSELVRGKRTMTPDMAHRLSHAFNDSPELWMNLQKNVDLWDLLHMDQSAYKKIQPLKAA